MLILENVSIQRGNLCVADSINLQFEAGQVYAILGANGAGKSSLLKTLFAEINHTGKIRYQNQILHPKFASQWRKTIAYMPQDTVLDASLTALEVVLLGQLDNLSMHISDDQLKAALFIMETLGILHLAERDVLSLSGGQRQMTIFAQVLLRSPQILLLDEPVSALDLHHQCVLLEHVRTQTRAQKLITLTILHDLNLASQFADKVIFLGDGKIQGEGEALEIMTQALIERLYRVRTSLFYSDDNQPLIVAKSAVKD